MKTRSRIHVVVGVMVAVCLLATPILAADRMLVTAQTRNGAWSTTAVLSLQPNATASVSVHVGDPACPSLPVTLAPGGVAVDRNPASSFICNAVPEFALIPAPAGVGAFTRLAFDDGVNRSSFVVPPIGAVDASAPLRLFPVVSDDADGVFVTVFPTEATDVRVGLGSWTGTFTARPPVTQFRVPVRGAGELSIELVTVICNLCPTPKPVYGFVTNGDPRGGNMRVLSF